MRTRTVRNNFGIGLQGIAMRHWFAIALTVIGVAGLDAAFRSQHSPASATPALACDGVGVALATGSTECLKPGSGKSFRDCPECPEMVVVPPGEFMMGAPETEKERLKGEFPQRKVTFAAPFAVGKFEVTFAEWEACVAGAGCTANKSPGDRGWGKGNRPIINVSWNNAKQYVEWLSARTGQILSAADGGRMGIRRPGRNDDGLFVGQRRWREQRQLQRL